MKTTMPSPNNRLIQRAQAVVLAFALQSQALSAQGSQNSLVARGYTQLASGQAKEAIKTLSSALYTNPKDTQARRYLAAALLRANQPQESLRQIQYVIHLEPGQANDQIALGEAHMYCGQYNDAIACLSKIISQNPYLDTARVDLIRAYIANRQLDKAKQACIAGTLAATTVTARNYYFTLMDQVQTIAEKNISAQEQAKDAPAKEETNQNQETP
jgi:tetratricopeptide (TPR) repeat protein